ncbi:MAG: hypothetical protein FK733_07390 [Asgard group archaeon]|nr:hypothetical protein [Asgard group archaeon]
MSKEKPKLYITFVLILIILITLLSVGILVVMSSTLLDESERFSETAEFLDSMTTIAEIEIQTILQEDTSKYEVTYSYLNDLYHLNEKYYYMIQYNQTNPGSYSSLEFDEVKYEFVILIQSIISIVNTSKVMEYSVIHLGADRTNNFTYVGFKNYLITDMWYEWLRDVSTINPDIISYLETTFTYLGKPLFIPIINIYTWTHHLYNNLSALEDLETTKLLDYLEAYGEDLPLTLVNLSIVYLSIYRDGYISLEERMDTIITNYNNTLITLALSGVLMGFATSFDNLNYRRISLIIGLLIFILALIYFTSATATLLTLGSNEAQIIGSRSFNFI